MTNNELISIDIFDTAIFRRVYKPSDIFKLIGDDFYNARIAAEQSCYRDGIKHPTLLDIYYYLPNYNMQDEIDLEFKYCYANDTILKMHNADPSKYVFISDMYLPSNVLARLLAFNGYINPRVYVSADLKACKSDGSLFKEVEKLTDSKIILHYGDNYVADVLGAKKLGIQTVYNPAVYTNSIMLPEVNDSVLKMHVARALSNSSLTIAEKLGYVYAPLFVEFTKWVIDNSPKDKTIFFASRDMYIPYIIARDILHCTNVKYLHVSRRSLSSINDTINDDLLKHRYNIFGVRDNSKSDINEVKKYLDYMEISDGDVFVDIGYGGTIQYSIEKFLGIKLNGLYLQAAGELIDLMNTKMFFNRHCIVYMMLVELPFCSTEDNIVGYKNCKPIFSTDSKLRKVIVKSLTNIILSITPKLLDHTFEVFDLEQLLIYLQYYPTDEFIELYNKKIFSNRETYESIINFDLAEIYAGNLIESYNLSYAKSLYLKLLQQHKDISYLSKLIS